MSTSTTTATPQASTSTQTAAPAAADTSKTVAPVASAPSQSEKDYRAEYLRVEAEKDRKVKEQIVERRKWEAEKKSLGEKLKAADEYERLKRMAKANPDGFIKHFYGDNAKDQLAQVWANGGLPTGEMLQHELMRQREELTAEFERRLAEKEAAAQQRSQTVRQQEIQRATEMAVSFWNESGKEYPAIKGSSQDIGAYLIRRIEIEAKNTGKVLTLPEMAEKVEGEIYAHAEEVAAHAKYQEKLRQKFMPQNATAAPKPSQQQSSTEQQPGQQQQRKTLTNGMTASTQGTRPALSEEERMKRAQAAYQSFRDSRQQH